MFEELLNDQGMYVDSRGTCFNDVVEYLHESQDWCGFCGCGQPEQSLLAIFRCLQLIQDFHYGPHDGKYDVWDRAWDKIGSDSVVCVLWYLLDHLGLTEHGTAVPGWLTNKGNKLLKALQEMDIETICLEEDRPCH